MYYHIYKLHVYTYISAYVKDYLTANNYMEMEVLLVRAEK